MLTCLPVYTPCTTEGLDYVFVLQKYFQFHWLVGRRPMAG